MAKKAPAKKAATSRNQSPDLAHIAEDLRPLATPIAELTPDPHNARRHGARNLETIAASLSRFGQAKPIVVLSDGTSIAGNGTVEAARSLGWTHVAATRFANAEQARAYALADNRTAELAEWDALQLAEQIGELAELDIDISDIGFDEAEIEALTGDVDVDHFAPDGEDTQGRLDATQPPKRTTCPSCGHEF